MHSVAPVRAGTPAPEPVDVPRELRPFAQWVGWDYRPTKGGLAKVPHRLSGKEHRDAPDRLRQLVRTASTTDPSTWSPYELARYHSRIGFVFTHGDPFCGVDLDDCIDPETGEMSLVARVAVRYCASYAEVSPSGQGVKIIVRGTLPGNRRQNRKLGVEMYDSGRFFTLTGERLSGASPHVRKAHLAPLYRWIFGAGEARPAPPVNTSGGGAAPARASNKGAPSGEQILDKALSARNGARFGRLWRGDASGYPTPSEADLALCAMLAYWSECDPAAVETLFSSSGLAREKWRSRPDYRRRTIRRAIATCMR